MFFKCMRCHLHRMHGACGIIDTACIIKFSNSLEKWQSYAKGLRWCYATKKKYDTACTSGEWLERPWHPLKGISIKNIYVPELSYPTTKNIYINVKGVSNRKFSGACGVIFYICIFIFPDTTCAIFASVIQGPRGYCLMKKTEGR
jgi:hypothetical protein